MEEEGCAGFRGEDCLDGGEGALLAGGFEGGEIGGFEWTKEDVVVGGLENVVVGGAHL